MTQHTHAPDSDPHFLKPGYLAPYLDDFAAELARQGYTSLTIGSYRQSIAHFGTWLQNQRIALVDINDHVITAFATHRCTCPGSRREAGISRRYAARVRQFFHFLVRSGVISAEPCQPGVARPPELAAFCHWLDHHRGLARRTIERHERLMVKLLPLLGDGLRTTRRQPCATWFVVKPSATVRHMQKRWRPHCGCICDSWPPGDAAVRVWMRLFPACHSGNSRCCRAILLPRT